MNKRHITMPKALVGVEMLRPIIVCKDHRVFRIVCDMYGFDPRKVDFAGDQRDFDGVDRDTPIFKYYSAGFPHWLTPMVMDRIAERFNNKFDLPEINVARRYGIEDVRFKR